jgi:hypothetical protein
MKTISSTTPVARKQHTCDYCCEKIEIGTKYENSFLVDDYPYTWKNHIHCQEIAENIKMFDEGNCNEQLFYEVISEEYTTLIDEKDATIRTFSEQLNFILDHYKINH